MEDSEIDVRDVLERLGGATSTARLCNVTKSAVSQWLKNGIPPARLMFLRLARPDVFGNDRRRNRKNDH